MAMSTLYANWIVSDTCQFKEDSNLYHYITTPGLKAHGQEVKVWCIKESKVQTSQCLNGKISPPLCRGDLHCPVEPMCPKLPRFQEACLVSSFCPLDLIGHPVY